ncbi:MAG TPA: TlpA disulfide reductase family protein [Phycisphaerales bacterium]|nr:TlpA disulfide reductase family protein [Phycisphaerales bacterium]HMP36395.1 TlpA disulfide reductase family protein [Phycisphaerales bacterium]
MTPPPASPPTSPGAPRAPEAPRTPVRPVAPGGAEGDAPRLVPVRPPSAQPTLKVGDRAPNLAVGEWIKGARYVTGLPEGEVETEFHTRILRTGELPIGKVYLVEFWATWCGPCMPVIPRLTKLQKEHRDQGLAVIGVTSGDPKNSIEQVRQFVAAKGPEMEYAVLFDDGRKTWDSWMTAAGKRGIPNTFVIDRSGAIVHIGAPDEAEEVVRQIMAGTFVRPDAEMLRASEEEFVELHRLVDSDPELALTKLAAWKETYPSRIPAYLDRMMVIYLRTGLGDDAKEVAETLLDRYAATEDLGNLTTMALMWTSERTNPLKLHPELAIEIAKKAVEVGKGDVGSQLLLADAYFNTGAVPQAIALAEEALANATNPRQKDQAERRLVRYRARN